MIRRLAFLTVILAAIPSSALGDVYVGGGLGQASFKDDVSNVTFDESTTGWKVYGGLRVLKFLGAEISYVDFGSLDGNEGGVSWEAESSGWDAFAVGALPIAFVELFVKAGVVYADLETRVSGNSSSDNDFDPAYGLGVALILGERVGIRAEWERFEIGTIDDLNMYGLGVELRF
jgi:hypothetical protein